jgi:hypothetical protein
VALSWFRVYGKPNNVDGPYIGEGLSTDYRVDHGEGWAVLSIYGANARPDARGEDARYYRRAADAKRAASLIEGS